MFEERLPTKLWVEALVRRAQRLHLPHQGIVRQTPRAPEQEAAVVSRLGVVGVEPQRPLQQPLSFSSLAQVQ